MQKLYRLPVAGLLLTLMFSACGPVVLLKMEAC